MSQDYPPTLAGVRAAGEQISALQQQVARLTAERDRSAIGWSEVSDELAKVRSHLDAIAEALGLDKTKVCKCGVETKWSQCPLCGEIIEPYDAPQYLPDQLPEMVTALKRENAALLLDKARLDWLEAHGPQDSYHFRDSKHQEPPFRRFSGIEYIACDVDGDKRWDGATLREAIDAAREALDAASKERG